MKNKFILLAIMALFCACDRGHTPQKTKVNGFDVIEFKGYEISTIEYNGHDYVMCAGSNGGGTSVTMIHSPSCKKCTI